MSAMSTPRGLREWSCLSSVIGAAGLVILLVWGIAGGSIVPEGFIQSDDPSQSDVALYKAVSAAMQDGDGYYQAVLSEQPARGYPTSPVMTVREPTLAWLTSTWGLGGAHVLLLMVGVLALGLAIVRLQRLAVGRVEWYAAALAGVAVAAMVVPEDNVWAHDIWAGTLILCAVLAYSRRNALPAVALLLTASLIRELAAPLLVVLLVLSWHRGTRRDAVAAGAALAAFGAFYLWHAQQVGELVAGAGGASPGWVEFGGWPFVVNAVWFSSAMTLTSMTLTAVIVVFALLGWIGRSGDIALFAVLVIGTYSVVFAVLGRPNNLYWGALFAPTLLVGIVWAPRAVWEMLRPWRHRTRGHRARVVAKDQCI